MSIEYTKELYHRMETLRSEMEGLYEEIDKLRAENDRLRDAAVGVAASLEATLSLLNRAQVSGVAPNRVAPSNKMFAQMLRDYEASLDAVRAVLKGDTP
jgi:predicted nuclease with TOPRIM domain